ncbi:MAG: hypothetical protein AAF725_00455 [Acidobacteriota bacterium]
MSRDHTPRQILFDSTSEVFATDSSGMFTFPLEYQGDPWIETRHYDEVRFIVSLWTPSANSVLDLDRTYAELRGSFDPDENWWVKLAEIEPVVPPYGAGDSFDGWIVLPILAEKSAFSIFGSGFEGRTRLQLRTSAYLVA